MKKLFNIAIQMDPWSTINPKGDSTYSLALEAQKRGHKLFYYSPNNLSLENNKVNAKGNFFTLNLNKNKFFSLKKIKKILNFTKKKEREWQSTLQLYYKDKDLEFIKNKINSIIYNFLCFSFCTVY